MDSKNRAAELTKQLRDSAKLHDPNARAAIELVKLIADAERDSLVNAAGDDMLRQQGSARRFQKLHTDLVTLPPNITPGANT